MNGSVVERMATIALQRVCVLGAGVSGLAAARLLLRLGAQVLICDKPRAQAHVSDAIEQLLKQDTRFKAQLSVTFSETQQEALTCDGVILSPGISLSHPVIIQAKNKGLWVLSELALADAALKRILKKQPSSIVKHVAITGTNGKTTTTALVGHLLSFAGHRVFVGGNIGTPLSDLVCAYFDGVICELPAFIVLELSSYQCECLGDYSPDIAVYLNLTPDHLERYQTIACYAQAKEKLFLAQREQGVSILNAEDDVCVKLQDKLITTKLNFSLCDKKNTSMAHLDAWLDAEENAHICTPLWPNQLISLSQTPLVGRHNRQNQLAALLVVQALGLDPLVVFAGLKCFYAVKHRIEKIAHQAGVDYYNDSKATNDDAAAKALLSFNRPIIWICGGRDKAGGYQLCLAAAQKYVKTVICFGEAKHLIAAVFSPLFPCFVCDDLSQAVAQAKLLAQPGDVVLLSPACSSFDQYKNYEARGIHFEQLVLQEAASG